MTNYSGKKILILGGADVHVKLVKAAKEMGVYTIVTDYLEDSPGKRHADKSYGLNIFDIDGIVKMCKEEKVNAVLSAWLDPCQAPYQQICEKLELPCFCTSEQVHVLSDKEAFKECCSKYNVDTIPSYTVEQLQEGNIGFPVLIKPSRSRGSRGCMICSNFQEAYEAVKRLR